MFKSKAYFPSDVLHSRVRRLEKTDINSCYAADVMAAKSLLSLFVPYFEINEQLNKRKGQSNQRKLEIDST